MTGIFTSKVNLQYIVLMFFFCSEINNLLNITLILGEILDFVSAEARYWCFATS